MADRESVDVKVSERVGNGKFFGGKTVYYDVSSKVRRAHTDAPRRAPPIAFAQANWRSDGELKQYYKASVTRRYSDFAWLQENLLKRYPSRLVPQLPPKNFQIATPGTLPCEQKAVAFVGGACWP